MTECTVRSRAVDQPRATAERITDATLAAGRAAGLLPPTVMVLVAGGKRAGGVSLTHVPHRGAAPMFDRGEATHQAPIVEAIRPERDT